ncbi:MAG: hypothetical protein K2Q25_02255 [Mycobacteriaceae bacterium]|nr:hypothetical protein [Mycobacteriaceae bacterium]
MATDVPLNILTRVTHVPNIAILLCHWFSLAWDAAAILVVLHWTNHQGITKNSFLIVSIPFSIAALSLGILFTIGAHPGGSTNLISYLGPTLTGTCYLAIFLVSILVSRVITLHVVRRELPNTQNSALRIALTLIGWESALFFLFVVLRTIMQAAVIEGHDTSHIDWIPATLAGLANILLICGYTWPEFSSYRKIYRAAWDNWKYYRRVYPLWADLRNRIAKSEISYLNPPQSGPIRIINLPELVNQHLADIDVYLTHFTASSKGDHQGLLIDTEALSTALLDLSTGKSHRDIQILEIAKKYSSRRKYLRRSCLDEIPLMIGVVQ